MAQLYQASLTMGVARGEECTLNKTNWEGLSVKQAQLWATDGLKL